MSDDVELEEVVALRECRAELDHLQVEYDTLDAHHHKYATWAAREWLAQTKRADTAQVAGYAAGLEAAARVCDERAASHAKTAKHSWAQRESETLADAIRFLKG